MKFNFSDKRTSILIDEQVPQFLHEHGSKFIEFIKKYYEWLATSRVDVEIEYLDSTVPDLNFDLENKTDDQKPQLIGLHTNSLSKIVSSKKNDRNNYTFQLRHYNKDFQTPSPLTDTNSPERYSIRNEISKGYSIDEFVEFLNDPYKELTEKNTNQNQKVKIKIKSFIQESEMTSKNTWNSNDVDKTLNSLVDNYMKEYLKAYPLSYPNQDGMLDINDKINRNYTVEDFKRFLVKHSREFYQSKGTEDSFRYLFRTVYNKEIDIYYPKEDILKASDNTYVLDNTIYMSPVINFNQIEVLSKYVYGESSGSYGVIDNYTIKNSLSREYVELSLNSDTISGNFLPNENLKVINDSGGYDNIGTSLLSLKEVKVLDSSTEKFSLNEKIFLDKSFNRVQINQIPFNMRKEYIELQVENLESGEITGFSILDGGNNYSIGDEIIFDHSECYMKNKFHRFIKAYVLSTCIYGSIKKIKVVVPGKGYIKLPKIVSIGSRKYDEDANKNAKITFISKNIGKVKSLRIINTGFGYETIQKKVDLNGDSNYDLEVLFGVESKSQGKLLNDNGFLSDIKKLQDSEFYQKFSYVIRSEISPKEYRNLVKRLVHPAGTRFFGEYHLNTQVNIGIKINPKKINEIELNDRNHIGKYSNTVLDEWNLYDNFDNTEIRQNDLIPTVIENDDDYKFLKLGGMVSLDENSNVVTGIGTDFLTSISSGDFIMIQDQGFEVVSVVSDLEMTLSQQSNETLTSENVLIRTSQIDTAG